MKKWFVPAAVLGGLYLVYRVSRIGNAAQQVSYSVASISYDKANSNALQSVLNVRIAINNPTNTPVTMQAFQATLQVNGQNLGNINMNQVVTIAANGITNLTTAVLVRHITLLGQLLTLAKQWITGQGQARIRVIGTATIAGATLPIDQTIDLTIPGRLGNILTEYRPASNFYMA